MPSPAARPKRLKYTLCSAEPWLKTEGMRAAVCVSFSFLQWNSPFLFVHSCNQFITDVSGVPGTGKTATVRAVLRELLAAAAQEVRSIAHACVDAICRLFPLSGWWK